MPASVAKPDAGPWPTLREAMSNISGPGVAVRARHAVANSRSVARSGKRAPSLQFFIGPTIAYIAIQQGAKCRMVLKAFDEMRSGAGGKIRSPYPGVARWLDGTSPE